MKKITFLTITAGLLIGFSIKAAEPEFLVSWQADSYTPHFYQGKALPTNSSNVTAALELLDNKRPVDTSKKVIRWYLDNNLYQSGAGLKTITFKIDPLKRGGYQLKVSLPNFNGQEIEHLTIVPVVTPETIIDTPYYGGLIKPGLNLFRSLFYFFNIENINQLSIVWTANGLKTESRAANPDILELNVPASAIGHSVNLNVNVKNRKSNFEFADDSINLEVGK